jgi:hypothetical protein
VWAVSARGRGDRFRLDAVPRRKPAYARYVEVVGLRAYDGTDFRVYWVEEYRRSGDTRHLCSYGVVIDESEMFWVASARRLELGSAEPDQAQPGRVPLMIGTYRSLRHGVGLSEHQGQACIVYAVERVMDDTGTFVPSRCGVRFVGDDAYWVVPAAELDVGSLVPAG